MNMKRLPVILIFIPNYLPGYKAGGILKTVMNTVDHLKPHFQFKVIARDRDLGDTEPYPGISINMWLSLGDTEVMYLPPSDIGIRRINQLLTETEFDVIYLNSFFDPVFTLRFYLMSLFGKLKKVPVIIAPRGELCNGCLSIKRNKKRIFLALFNTFIKAKAFHWQASSIFEKQDMLRELKLDARSISCALDLPLHRKNNTFLKYQLNEPLKIIFLSRITREKNLDYALEILAYVKRNIVFDIYGIQEDSKYWKECENLMSKLPANIKVTYCGKVNPDDVPIVFSKYDLFFFPTKGENYGHVMVESLNAGTPILITKETPWRDLDRLGMGWDFDINDKQSFINILETFSYKDMEDRLQTAKNTSEKIERLIYDDGILNDNINLFHSQILNR
jgi:glycosyltransferase involved in cell wall biosynthesis